MTTPGARRIDQAACDHNGHMLPSTSKDGARPPAQGKTGRSMSSHRLLAWPCCAGLDPARAGPAARLPPDYSNALGKWAIARPGRRGDLAGNAGRVPCRTSSAAQISRQCATETPLVKVETITPVGHDRRVATALLIIGRTPRLQGSRGNPTFMLIVEHGKKKAGGCLQGKRNDHNRWQDTGDRSIDRRRAPDRDLWDLLDARCGR